MLLYYNYLRMFPCSVKTDLMEEGANSSLSVARVNKTDSGNYTCSISPTENATVTVHVLNGGCRAFVIYTYILCMNHIVTGIIYILDCMQHYIFLHV